MNYYFSSIIHLSLESYYNRGLTPEKAKEIIEGIRDYGSDYGNLWCQSSGINSNWSVRTLATDPVLLDGIARLILIQIEDYLSKNKL